MAELGNRLKTMADYIKAGETMADIGTDHGFLPLYLWEKKICPKVIMTDISAGSLNKARAAFPGQPPGADFRLGDGLTLLAPGEVDAVVIAGMGGVLITEILSQDMEKTISFSKFIMQPRNGSGKLRYFLDKAGFAIISENLAEEGKFICEIIVAKPPKKVGKVPSLAGYKKEAKYEMPYLPVKNEELFIKYVNNKLNIEKEIFEAMKKGGYVKNVEDE